jgi:phosphoribosylaminoimidazole carboxylase PurE protein
MSIGILLGSDSDWDKVCDVVKVFNEFGIKYELNVMSAHRTPELVKEYASSAESRGISILICAAGGAAHLAGVVASHTILPVIGIPVQTEFCGGLDSLLSTVQMPGDIPVATVGVGTSGARNAGLLAIQILALNNENLKQKLLDFREKIVQKIKDKNTKLKKQLEKYF